MSDPQRPPDEWASGGLGGSAPAGPARGTHTFLLRAGGTVELSPDGFHHPLGGRSRRFGWTSYGDLTHVAVSGRFLWLGTARAAHTIPRRAFVDPAAPERLERALVERIARLPDGQRRLRHMVDLDARARSACAPLACRVLAGLCVVIALLETWTGPGLFTAGYFSPALFEDGDWWRVVTGNLLHGFPLHLVLNVLGLLVVGRLLERTLGSARTVAVMGASALGSMIVSGWFEPGSVVGVSGVVFGLAGGVLWLEIMRGAELPAMWRLPQGLLRLVLIGFALDVLIGFLVPFVAGEAHLGGFAAGLAATAGLARGERLNEPSTPRIRALAAGVVGFAALATAVAGFEAFGPGDYMAEHAGRLARLPRIPPEDLNNHAWFIAIDEDATREQMQAALLLAERAVDETERSEATILDTLAEVLFQLDRPGDAAQVIEEAILLDPGEPYYREQWRRFRGERDPDDRPPDPALRPRERETPLQDDDGSIHI